MNILIIGGSRFVGPLLVEKLLKKKHQVTIFNRGHYPAPSGVSFIQGDRSKFSIDTRFDIVIDMCAYNGIQTKTALNQLNFDFFIHFSTAAVYKKSDQILTEDSPLGDWPLWGGYNKGKVECEKVLATSGVKFAAIRPVYILGPKNYCDREHFIYSRILSSTPIVLPGDGQALVQFVFAKEVADSIALIAEKKAVGPYNCAGDEKISLQNLVLGMGKIVGQKPVIQFNQKANGEFKEENFPFANETFLCGNSKLKSLGMKFTPLLNGLKTDYKQFYSKII